MEEQTVRELRAVEFVVFQARIKSAM
jgi:hypothetical protein